MKTDEQTLGPLRAAAVLLALNGALAWGAEGGVETTPIEAPGPLEATELSPLGGSLPAELAARRVVMEGGDPVPFAVLIRRIGEAGAVAVAIEERPPRIAGGAAILPEPPALRPGYEGPLGRFLDRVAAESGYRWAYEADTVVFYRYWDRAERRPGAEAGAASP